MYRFITLVRRYGFTGLCKLFISLIFTRFLYPKARIIRFPFDLRNRKFIDLGTGITVGRGCRIESYDVLSNHNIKLRFGVNVELNDYVHISAGESIEIGNNVLIASKVFISDINHGFYSGAYQDSPYSIPSKRPLYTKPVLIEDNVWIGEGVCVLSGVTIGSGTIIGAGSIVTKDIPPNTIAVGSPCQVVKKYNDTLKKWEYFN